MYGLCPLDPYEGTQTEKVFFPSDLRQIGSKKYFILKTSHNPLHNSNNFLQNPPKKAICGINPKLHLEKHKKKILLLILAKN